MRDAEIRSVAVSAHVVVIEFEMMPLVLKSFIGDPFQRAVRRDPSVPAIHIEVVNGIASGVNHYQMIITR